MKKLIAVILVTTGTLLLSKLAISCNEAVCGSVVSKCLLTQSCNCDFKNCTCCKDCYNCLSYLYSECCSCVNMCPNNNISSSPNQISYVESFSEPVPGLFRGLTDEPDTQDRWISKTFPVDIDISQYQHKKEIKIHMQTNEQEVLPKTNVLTLNCTVVFMSSCRSNSKCRNSCVTMGSSSYRWFHDGCCQCIGENCINYGIDESRCKNCTSMVMEEENDQEENDDDSDYAYDDEDD